MKLRIFMLLIALLGVAGAIWTFKPGMKYKSWDCVQYIKIPEIKLLILLPIPETKEYITYLAYNDSPTWPVRFSQIILEKEYFKNIQCPATLAKNKFLKKI